MGKRNICRVCFVMLVVLCLTTGCAAIDMEMSVTDVGSGSIRNVITLHRAEYIEYLRDTHPDLGMESDAEDILQEEIEQGVYSEEVIDGVEYLVMDTSDGDMEFDSISDFYSQIGLDSGYELTETSFCMDTQKVRQEKQKAPDLAKISEEQQQKYFDCSYIEISVCFAYPVKETNGTVDEGNPNQVSWKYSLASVADRIYAYCDSSISVSGVVQGSVSQKPVTLHFEGADTALLDGKELLNDTVFSVDGAYCVTLSNEQEQKTIYFAIDRTAPKLRTESGEEVSFRGWQKEKKVIYLWDDNGILSAELDGVSVLECSLTGQEEFVYYVTIAPAKLSDGKHTLVVKDIYGNQKNVTFQTDKTPPEVKTVKNKGVYRKAVTIKFSDAVSGIKKAQLNGKKIASGKKIKKVGVYTLKVTDKAGNSTNVKFEIKEKKKTKS